VESVYEEALCYELSQAGLEFKRQQQVPIIYKDVTLATPLRLDLTLEERVIVDNKSKKEVTDIDKQSLLTYFAAAPHAPRLGDQLQCAPLGGWRSSSDQRFLNRSRLMSSVALCDL
jgi:hypothetical protein